VEAAGIRHRYITPRRPEQNDKVERSHRIDDEEFWPRPSFASFEDAAVALEAWEHRYNHERFSMALRGHYPG
jgi:transposase InsO family protein